MAHPSSNGQRKAAAHGLVFEVRSAAIWIQMRLGVQAALCARPEDLENCKPRTELGKVVRGLVLEAGKGRAGAMKTLLRFLEYVEDEEAAAVQRVLPDVEWDWSAEGVWLTKAEATEESQEPAMRAEWPASPTVPKNEPPLSRQQRRYLARLGEKRAARPDAVPIHA